MRCLAIRIVAPCDRTFFKRQNNLPPNPCVRDPVDEKCRELNLLRALEWPSAISLFSALCGKLPSRNSFFLFLLFRFLFLLHGRPLAGEGPVLIEEDLLFALVLGNL